MSAQTATSRFILSPSEANSAELYQSLLRGIENYQQLGNRLIRLAEQAHAFRQFDRVRDYGHILFQIPIKTYRAVGTYFLAVATNRNGKGDQSEARRLFEAVVDEAPDTYKVKAMLSLGALSFNRRDFDSALYFYNQGLSTGKWSASGLHAIRAISVFKAIEGNHADAVEDLEKLLPVIKYAPAHIRLDILNSYAVELGEVGRKEEARNLMRVVLASPFASAYPEWRETAEDLRPSRRSFVAAGCTDGNVLTLPERESNEQPAAQPKPARVLDLAKWKEQMATQDKDRKIEKELRNMSLQDLGFKLLELITQKRPDRAQMRVILDFALSLFSQPGKAGPDEPAS